MDTTRSAYVIILVICALVLWPLSRGLAVGPPPPPKLVNLQTINDLRSVFNQDHGKVRIILLLSPT
jgi:hypothetical protein